VTKHRTPKLPYPEHLMTLWQAAERADRIYLEALRIAYGDSKRVARLPLPERDRIEAQRRCMTHRFDPALATLKAAMQDATDEWIEAHRDHWFAPGAERIGSRRVGLTVTHETEEEEAE
jgi:hypothetical protein